MRPHKRKADDDRIGSKAATLPRINSPGPEYDHEHDPASNVSSSASQFNVEIKLRSASKAARNDPKPAGWLQERLGLLGTEDSENSGSSVTPEVVVPPSDHTASAGLHGIASTGRGADQPASADRKIEKSVLSEISSGEEVEDDGSEGYSDLSECDEFAEFDWLEAMDGLVTRTQGRSDGSAQHTVGVCHGKLIRRGEIRASFYHNMDEPSRETSMLAFELFDRYGRLRSEVKDHAVRKGSGVWNEELDIGDILLIEHVRVEKEYRRRGLGSEVVGSMVDKARSKSRKLFAIVWPAVCSRDVEAEIEGLLDSEDKDQVYSCADAAAVRFFRSIGFRRIGSTCWFGLACGNDHPSHLLAPEDDYDPPKPPSTASDLELQPLQRVLVQSSDQECLTALSNCLLQTPATGLDWQGIDAQGNTLLHLAGLNSKAASVEWIMMQEFGPRMLEKRNHEGDLPLEAVVFKLENLRTRRVHENVDLAIPASDKFEGYSAATVHVLVALKGLKAPTDLDLACLASGCTCGQCVSGFLSPRMCFTLLCQAEVEHDMLSISIEQESGPEWVDFREKALEYLPHGVRENLKTNKSMRQGFVSICDHIATCLRAKEMPYVLNVLHALDRANEWPPVTKNFLQRGGSIESVALMIFQTAMDRDALAGDGMHEEVFCDDIGKLPECRNDHEFGFVSGMCGYKRISQIHYVSFMGEPMDEP